MTNATPSPATPHRSGWFKSSYSNATGSCVEVNLSSDTTLVRDSKDRRSDQPVIGFSPTAWSFFLRGLTSDNS